MDCSPPGSSVHGIPQGRTLGWVVISFSRGSSPSKDQNHVSCVAGGFFTISHLASPQLSPDLLSFPPAYCTVRHHRSGPRQSPLSLSCLPWRCFPAPWTMLSKLSQPLSSPLTCQQHLQPKLNLPSLSQTSTSSYSIFVNGSFIFSVVQAIKAIQEVISKFSLWFFANLYTFSIEKRI